MVYRVVRDGWRPPHSQGCSRSAAVGLGAPQGPVHLPTHPQLQRSARLHFLQGEGLHAAGAAGETGKGPGRGWLRKAGEGRGCTDPTPPPPARPSAAQLCSRCTKSQVVRAHGRAPFVGLHDAVPAARLHCRAHRPLPTRPGSLPTTVLAVRGQVPRIPPGTPCSHAAPTSDPRWNHAQPRGPNPPRQWPQTITNGVVDPDDAGWPKEGGTELLLFQDQQQVVKTPNEKCSWEAKHRSHQPAF